MSAVPSLRKTHSDKHKQILKALLKEAANKTCVDCKTATHPRWALWNLGCFICIRCLGIHRLMGTHISRVKSVDLDAWTDEQIELMIKWGNHRCNLYWESKLPDGYVPDQLKIENFIRTKYSMRKWVMSSKVPDPLTLTGDAVTAPAATISTSTTPTTTKSPAPTASNGNVLEGNLLDDDFGSFTSSPLHSPAVRSPAPQESHSGASAQQVAAQAPARPSSAHLAPPARQANQRTDLKKSILSLYSLPSLSQSTFNTTSANIKAPVYAAAPAAPAAPAPSNSGNVASLSDSLLDLHFGPPATAQKPQHTPPARSSMHNPVYTNQSFGIQASQILTPNAQRASTFLTLSPASASQSSLLSASAQRTNQSGRSDSQLGVISSNWGNEWADAESASSAWQQTPVHVPSTLASTFKTSSLDDDLFKNVWS